MTRFLPVFLCALALLSGCRGPSGSTVEEKQKDIRAFRAETLTKLYESQPKAKEQVEAAAGYVVMSNMNNNLFMLSTTSGYGVLTQKDGKETFLKVLGVGGGMGLGFKIYREVLVFKTAEALKGFQDRQSVAVSGAAELTAKAGDKKAADTAITQDLDTKVLIYMMTDAGFTAQATVRGTKYMPFKELNEKKPGDAYDPDEEGVDKEAKKKK